MRSDKEFLEAVTAKLETARSEALAKRARRRRAAAVILPAAAALGIVIGGSLVLRGRIGSPETTPLHQIEESPSVAETDPVKIVQETPGASSKPEIDPGTVPETEKDTEPETQPAEPRMRVVYADAGLNLSEESAGNWNGGLRGGLAVLLERYEGEDVWFSVKVTVKSDPEKTRTRDEAREALAPLRESYRSQIEEAGRKAAEIKDADPQYGEKLAEWYTTLQKRLQFEQEPAYIEAEKQYCLGGMVPVWEETRQKLEALGAREVEQTAAYTGSFYALMTVDMIRTLAADRDHYALDTTRRRVRTTDGSALSDELAEWLEQADPDTRFDVAASIRIDAENYSLKLLTEDSALQNVNKELTRIDSRYLPAVIFPDYESYRASVEAGGKSISELLAEYEDPAELLQTVIDRNGLTGKITERRIGNTSGLRNYITGGSEDSYLNGMYAGFKAEALTKAEVLALADDPEIKLIVGMQHYRESYRVGGKVNLKLAVLMEQMSDADRMAVIITADTVNYGLMSDAEIEASLLAQFGWNKTVDAPADVTLEQIYAYRDARNEMIYGPSRKASAALLEKLSEKGFFGEEEKAALTTGGYTFISAALTRIEILAIANDPDVSNITIGGTASTLLPEYGS